MPTILTHPAIPLALGLGLDKDGIPKPLLAAGVVASVLPDLDVVAFGFGVSYASGFGHRGFSHSLFFAAAVALIGAYAFRSYQIGFVRAFGFLFLSAASHGVLDAFTNGGLGVAFLWPWSTARFYAPVQVIEVSPLSPSRLLSARGSTVLVSELLWVWTPGMVVGFSLAVLKRIFAMASVRLFSR